MTDALLDLGRRALGAAAAALEELVPGGVAAAEPATLAPAPLAGAELPAVLAEATLDGRTTGRIVLVLTVPGARRLAAALGAIDEEEAEFGGAELGDRELGAVCQAFDGALRAVAAADASLVPGRAAARLVEDAAATRALTRDTDAAAAPLTLLGEAAQLVLLVAAGVLEGVDAPAPAAPPASPGPTPLSAALRDISVRVWAELGRARMPTGEVVGLPSGAIVELDRDADDAVDLYVDGQCYASGRLVVTEDDSWGVLVEHVHGPA